jgi:hypothetical protein
MMLKMTRMRLKIRVVKQRNFTRTKSLLYVALMLRMAKAQPQLFYNCQFIRNCNSKSFEIFWKLDN